MMKIKYTRGLLLTQQTVRIVLNVASEIQARLISLPVPIPRETPFCITDAFRYPRDMRSDIPVIKLITRKLSLFSRFVTTLTNTIMLYVLVTNNNEKIFPIAIFTVL